MKKLLTLTILASISVYSYASGTYVLEMNSNSDSYTLFDCSQKCQISKTIPDGAKSYDIKSSKLRSIIDNSSCNSRGDICNIEMKQKNGIVTGLSSISKLGEI